jgi:hypothetical protein
MIPHFRYQYHCQPHCHCCLYQSLVTCTNTQHVGDLKWVCICETGIVCSNSIVRMPIVSLPSRQSTSGDFSWREHNSLPVKLNSSLGKKSCPLLDIDRMDGRTDRLSSLHMQTDEGQACSLQHPLYCTQENDIKIPRETLVTTYPHTYKESIVLSSKL